MGYHEKAFDMFLPFSLDDGELSITEENYLPLWLDAFDHPEHYDGKSIRFVSPMELRKNESGGFSIGRVVMTCCMADLQFMSFEAEIPDDDIREGWVTSDAEGIVAAADFGRKKLMLKVSSIRPVSPPADLILDSTK